MPFQKGHALSHLSGKVGRALSKGARPFLSNQTKLGMSFQKGPRPFPFIKQCAKNLEWMEE
jgi:hypothetical protein